MFEWDEAKSQRNLLQRGFNFAFAAMIFDGPILEMDDPRAGYSERRVQAIGRAGGYILFIVYTWRVDVRRIISARKANRRERDVYREIFSRKSAQPGESQS